MANSNDIDNGRRMPRFRQRLALRYSLDEHQWRKSTTQDVGPRGMFIYSRERVMPGERVAFALDLPSGRTIEGHGRIAWERVSSAEAGNRVEAGFGLQFEAMPEVWYGWVASL